jgi:hypothetical protein
VPDQGYLLGAPHEDLDTSARWSRRALRSGWPRRPLGTCCPRQAHRALGPSRPGWASRSSQTLWPGRPGGTWYTRRTLWPGRTNDRGSRRRSCAGDRDDERGVLRGRGSLGDLDEISAVFERRRKVQSRAVRPSDDIKSGNCTPAR